MRVFLHGFANSGVCRVLAGILAVAMLPWQASAMPTPRSAPALLHDVRPAVQVSVDSPARIAVPEPRRQTPPPLPSANQIRPSISQDVRKMSGSVVRGPHMLTPLELKSLHIVVNGHHEELHYAKPTGGNSAAATPGSVRGVVSAGTVSPSMIVTPGPIVGTPVGTARRVSSQIRTPAAAQTLAPAQLSASGTGINHWWRYQEQSVPGVGRLMVNVGTGNMLLDVDDMAVPHKGVSIAFRRTYNSQSGHDVNGSDGSPPGEYGNGWTNTFDAHLMLGTVGTTPVISVYDINGTRYDYSINSNGSYSPPPGQYAQLTDDGACGLVWTKKSGVQYHFYRFADTQNCTLFGQGYGGLAGRLFQIAGRNGNTSLNLSYGFVSGKANPGGLVSQIVVRTESSALAAVLNFSSVSGHELLTQMIFPDGFTQVNYSYDSNGNLTLVNHPSNDGPVYTGSPTSSGTPVVETYGYGSLSAWSDLGSGYLMSWVASPRWYASCSTTCGTDGGYVAFNYSGGQPQNSVALSNIWHVGVGNPIISDASGTGPLQRGVSSAYSQFLSEYYQTGVSTPTYRDSDGHMTNWVVDAAGRPVQTQECTASTNQGQQCTATWLITGESWDANNNLISTVEPRGYAPGVDPKMYETDNAYDGNGNTIAVAEPSTATSLGTFRPTRLYDYDPFNNVVAFCDENETNQGGADWTSTPAESDSLCSSHSAAHTTMLFSYPSYQPYGRLESIVSSLGYARHISYVPLSQQGGSVDYGLPTSVAGDSFAQADGTSIAPTSTFWYDVNGSLRCYSKGQGISVIGYDGLGRMTSIADADDSSANSSSVCGKTGGQAGWNTQTTYAYFAGGALQSSQSPSERAYGTSSTFVYDVDGDVTSEIRHHGCVSTQNCAPGVTTKWYDGAGRLVEVQQPHDSRTYQDSSKMEYDGAPWLVRYLYDLSGGGSVAVSGAPSGFQAYGNLYKVQSLIAGTWSDVRATAFDALDRPTAKYAYHTGATSGPDVTRNTYDAPLGFLSSATKPTGESATYSYDELGRTRSISYSGATTTPDGASISTPGIGYVYDPVGRTATATSTQFGAETFGYDAVGNLTDVYEPTGGGVSDPAHISYTYYGDGKRRSVSIVSSSFSQADAIAYSYRVDGILSSAALSAFVPATWMRQYTDAGRLTSQVVGSDTQQRGY
ncbi:MAG: hypothetical protein JOZ01_09665, partial [Candidatus Eremiobacteraeota bacterium]|nr:hypothetical protein [Candidatus Eremiobacteraeota bacterium]